MKIAASALALALLAQATAHAAPLLDGGAAAASASPAPPAPSPDDGNPEWQTGVGIAVAVMAGLVLLVLGYRLFRPVMAVVVTVLFAIVTYFIVDGRIDSPNQVSIPVSIGVGLVGGVLAYIFWRLTLPFLGALVALLVTAIVISSPAHSKFEDDGPIYGLFAPLVVALGVVCFIFPRPSVIASTSLVGALGVFVLVDHYVESGFMQGVFSGVARIFQTHSFFGFYISYDYLGWAQEDSHRNSYLVLGGWFALAVVGMALQQFLVARNYHHDPDHGKQDVDLFANREQQPLMANSHDPSSTTINHGTFYRSDSLATSAANRQRISEKYGINLDKPQRL
ncbi:hypothetical protein CAOG_007223 [Capsaspora owczarzaki ATCC 30864]|uniref:Transmembrane protein 198 n=2 Tax=Capsaspora owczarzaki (strain ATCC 30864) TaxID=595528 RepID=A0A0D2VZQ2_CAPO3|nr:hypothetical protein CAOG_007223 [Capsaspora owczarzaki ATCC 30864]